MKGTAVELEPLSARRFCEGRAVFVLLPRLLPIPPKTAIGRRWRIR